MSPEGAACGAKEHTKPAPESGEKNSKKPFAQSGGRAGNWVRSLTGKQLHKLSREDLLKLLLAQSQELSKQKETITALNTQGESSDEALKRLKSKLDEKDAQIERLKRKLD